MNLREPEDCTSSQAPHRITVGVKAEQRPATRKAGWGSTNPLTRVLVPFFWSWFRHVNEAVTSSGVEPQATRWGVTTPLTRVCRRWSATRRQRSGGRGTGRQHSERAAMGLGSHVEH